MRRRTIATVAAGATVSLLAGGVALAQTAPGMGAGSGMPVGGGMAGMMGMMRRMGGMAGTMGSRGATQGMHGMQGMHGQDADRWFIEEMIPHHEDAIIMADLALAQAEHTELRALAGQIKTSQSQEIAQMRAWYQAWYGTAEVPPGAMSQMHESMGPMMDMMHGMMGMGSHSDHHGTGNSARSGGNGATPAPMGAMPMGAMHADPKSIDGAKPFDKAFIEHMVPHHQMAVMMATHALASAQRPEMQALLHAIITTQSAEIAQMQNWYRAWYPTTP